MARLRRSSLVEGDDRSTMLRDSSHVPSSARRNSYAQASASASPTPSVGSDKENGAARQPKNQSMGPPPVPQSPNNNTQANKRRRLSPRPGDVDSNPRSMREHSTPIYDPHQDTGERQRIRKGLRDLNVQILDNRSEWLQPHDQGLYNAVTQANALFGRVKQTSDATIDSRFLVTAGDLAYKKTQQASLGDGSQGVDVDEFVTKCLAFMRRGDEVEDAQPTQHASTSTQQRRRRTNRRNPTEIDSDDEDADTIGNAFNWAYLGSHACFPVTARPPAPSFLLGPLSVQKKARQQIQRRARAERVNPENAVKPRQLEVDDLTRQEDSSLTSMCKNIHAHLGRLIGEAEKADTENATEEEFNEICTRNKVLDNGGVSLFDFAFNPRSFGQTIENIFYVSFLIKEGAVGVDFEGDGLGRPTLHWRNTEHLEDDPQSVARSATKFQSVIGIDFDDWKAACETFDIQSCLIAHRSTEHQQDVAGAHNVVGRSAWYG